jgi:streptomycin 6-kinase
MPRWWHDEAGRAWLDRLPALVQAHAARWGLRLDGQVRHGSNALVVPVRKGPRAAVLRLAPPGDDLVTEAAALRHWAGHGVVELLEVDVAAGVMLLERLDAERSLHALPPLEAAAVLGRIARDLAIPAPDDAPSTREIAAEEADAFARRWSALGEPVPHRLLAAATSAARRLAARDPGGLSVDGDLHHGQILAGGRREWTVVDPVLLRGDAEYDLGRVLWTRLDELPGDRDVLAALDAFVTACGVPSDRARDWVLVRSMSYLLWGLEQGLTLDPPRCRRLLELLG